jgi:hypothetical protein
MKALEKDAVTGETHPIAGLICIFGVVLRLATPPPLLSALGFDFSGDMTGAFYQKIHPGTYFIIASYFVLLAGRGNPFQQFLQTVRDYTIYNFLLMLYVLLFIYWAIRGPVGVGMLIETHMVVPVCAIVLSYMPRAYCQRVINFFVVFAVMNSLIGMAESIGRFRIFTYPEDWVVLKELSFRSSALLGHPLNNAMFTPVMLLVAMAMRYSAALKGFLLLVFLASLVAFGGRGGFGFSVLSLMPLGLIAIKKAVSGGQLTLARLFVLIAAALVIPIFLSSLLYLLMSSDMGARIMETSAFEDESANARWLAFKAFEYMTREEIIFGIGADRGVEIAYRMGLALPLSDIENPWILMAMFLGGIMFPIWLAATAAFVWRLMRGKPPALQLAVLAYFVVASTSNSFGRKDLIYSFMVSAVICAAQALGVADFGQRSGETRISVSVGRQDAMPSYNRFPTASQS